MNLKEKYEDYKAKKQRKKLLKRIKKKLKDKDFWTKVIIFMCALALIASTILPYIAYRFT